MRTRLRNAKRLPLEALAPFLLELPSSPGPLDWSALFRNANPVELEIGFGKGLFLLTAAEANPHINYVGVEIDRGLQLYTATRIAKRGLKNVRLARHDARFFVRDYISTESLQAVHVYFPDPWWKKRHKKRRVFTAEFAAECQRILVPGGKLYLATDVEEYFSVMTQLVAEQLQLRQLDTSAQDPSADGGYLTNFERKAKERGERIWRAAFEKEPGIKGR